MIEADDAIKFTFQALLDQKRYNTSEEQIIKYINDNFGIAEPEALVNNVKKY